LPFLPFLPFRSVAFLTVSSPFFHSVPFSLISSFFRSSHFPFCCFLLGLCFC
jgi:hypothetical protein